MAGDASFASVTTLLHGNEDFTDSAGSPKVYTPYGSAVIDTGVKKFGAGSMSFSAGNSYIFTPYHADFDLGAGQFTIECWVRFTSLSAESHIYSRGSASTGITRESSFGVLNTTTVRFYYGVRGSSATTRDFTVPTMATATWYHLAITRDGSNNLRVFLDGVQSSTGPVSDSTNLDGALPTVIGCFWAGAVYSPLDGRVDDLRVTKGVARYTADFTPPAAQFIAGLGQVAGTVYDGAGSPAARTVRAYRRDTGALVRSTVSDATSGAYAIDCPTLDEVIRVVFDDAASPLYNDIIDRVIPA